MNDWDLAIEKLRIGDVEASRPELRSLHQNVGNVISKIFYGDFDRNATTTRIISPDFIEPLI